LHVQNKKMAQEKEETLVDVEEVYSKTERYIEENKKSLAIIVGAIVLVIAGYFAWSKLIIGPREADAQKDMFMAEQYFEKDSLDKAINGDGNFYGFQYIVDNYGFTKSANLAHYYLGISYLRKGEFEKAIDHLEEFEAQDDVVGPIATGAIGDANMELGKTDDAIDHYIKAAKMGENKFVSPIFLMKAGLAYEDKKDYKNAIKVYEQIKKDYSESTEGKEIEKYIAHAKALTGA